MRNDAMQQMKIAGVRISGFGFPWVLGCLGISAFLVLCSAVSARANYVQVSDTALAGDKVSFKLAWDNSWREVRTLADGSHVGEGEIKVENWDAAWVFVKFRRKQAAAPALPGGYAAAGWSHATLSPNTADHMVPNGATLDIGLTPRRSSGPAVGAFIYRSESNRGHGANNWKITLNWQREADGVAAGAEVEIRVFAIEMVYVAKGPFALGTGGREKGRFFHAADPAEPFIVTSEDEIITKPETKGCLWGAGGAIASRWSEPWMAPDPVTLADTGESEGHDSVWIAATEDDVQTRADGEEAIVAPPISGAFPKGFNGFYCMKYEITQGQYAAFLNSIPEASCGKSTSTSERNDLYYSRSPLSHRYSIHGDWPNIKADTPHVACNFLSWKDGASYASWAGLRPMSELEFEKACRGPLKPVPGEYAWGTAEIAGARYVLDPKAVGTAKERVRNDASGKSVGNAVYNKTVPQIGTPGPWQGFDDPTGPLRAGVFMEDNPLDRAGSGSSFWGIMELSGNLWERAVTIGHYRGRGLGGNSGFVGQHGDGSLNVPGLMPRLDVVLRAPGWNGGGFRGGYWLHSAPMLRVSDRVSAAALNPTGRYAHYGFRAVRTASGAQNEAYTMVAKIPVPVEEVAEETPPKEVETAELLRVTNVSLAARDETTATITFDIQWPGSWRRGSFHDAAWVFFKVRPKGEKRPSTKLRAGWQHVRLSADKVLNPVGYRTGDGTAVEFVVPEGKDGFTGTFVRRAEDGSGPVAATGVSVIMDLSSLPPASRDLSGEVRGFGVEMVYVPEGPYYLGQGNEETAPILSKGAGGNELNWFYKFGDHEIVAAPFYHTREVYVWSAQVAREKGAPYYVDGPGPIPTGREPGRLWAIAFPPEDGGELPAAFPNGYRAYYCMRYAYISEGQYADFLNTLPPDQAAEHYRLGGHGYHINEPSKLKNVPGGVIRSGKKPDYSFSCTEPDRRSRYLSWKDGSAFTAWAGLRPMTELEYEKAIRGPRIPIPGDASLSYYGVQDVQATAISERPVTVGSAMGRAFKGTHGTGSAVPPADWPAELAGGVFRGDYLGPMHDYSPALLTAGRLPPNRADDDRRSYPYVGWRAARTAPAGDTAMKPLLDPLDLETTRLKRLAKPCVVDGKLDEWGGAPVLTLDSPALIYPVQYRFAPSAHAPDAWSGPDDMSVRAHMAWDGEALCVAAEVKDDEHTNAKAGKNIAQGDCMQFSVVTMKDVHWNFGLALVKQDVVLHQWDGPTEEPPKSIQYKVTRDEQARTTVYELRMPLADLGVEAGKPCSYYFRFMDRDAKQRLYWFQWAPTVERPFKRDLYPRFELAE
ncbi:MAG: SUMF1/EgtB/PvdO family nonheme iron enzyme [Kiritimatiellia bacterium]|nr:SUMF1/EgtB/PvdO family nonheme iron enzyme [Kiritimatiellia bacterium]